MENNRNQLLSLLQAIDFAIYDTVLYLDAYPENKKALEYYNSLIQDKNAVKAELQAKYGPLTVYENTGNEWKWTDNPWPWQLEANI